MRKLTRVVLQLLVCLFFIVPAIAQSGGTVVSGTIKNAKSKEVVSAVSVTIKGTSTGSFTDDNGNFKFTTVVKPPFKLVVSSVGFSSKEVEFKGENLTINITPSYSLGEEVVVSASRVPEKILESPVSIERVSAANIRNAAAASYYDILKNLKGVDVTTASLTFNSISTRGFNGSGNLRLNQIVDGMDNQAPGLNFSVGNVLGLSELDVESMELLSGASSALYGPGGMNGTLIINSKDPFKYQGTSFQIKQGVKDIDGYQRPMSAYYDWSIRVAKKVTDKFAFKFNAQMVQAKDWLANNQSDYSRAASLANPFGQVTNGSRSTDPNYDGVNVYGDETTASLAAVSGSVLNAVKGAIGGPLYNALYGGSNLYLNTLNPSATLAQYNAFLNANGGAGLVAAGYSPFFYGTLRNYYSGLNVSRTGYGEKDVVAPTTLNVKLSGGLYYKFNNNVEASLTANWGTGNTVYTGSDRYSLKNLKMGQYKLEFKAKDWFLRGYATFENSGDSYNATIATRLFNEAWMPSSSWYPTYTSAFTQYVAAGLSPAAANLQARAIADANRPSGSIINNPLFQKIVQTPIKQGGALFLDRTSLYNIEGQYNLTNALGLNKTGTEFLVGGNYKTYVLNSQGTLFADTAGKIKIQEIGAYAQLSQQLFNDVLKLSVSGRYDKNQNFDGRFTPRASAVVKVAKDQNFRFSYQQAYRFPSTQNQYISLSVAGGTILSGGLQQMIDYYNLNTSPVVDANGNVVKFSPIKPETSNSYEIGYKGLFGKRLLIDVYGYMSNFTNFISTSNGLQLATGKIFSVAQNIPNVTVKSNGWGASAQYLLGNNYTVSGNIYQDQISNYSDLPVGFLTYFNTPKTRFNFGLGNTGFLYKNRVGFSVNYKWQESFNYEGSFAVGTVPSFGVVDAMISYKFPEIKSLIKFGANNLFNKYYINGFGNAQIGGLYYVSFGYNVF